MHTIVPPERNFLSHLLALNSARAQTSGAINDVNGESEADAEGDPNGDDEMDSGTAERPA
jgi:hypothetical protein